MVDCVCKESVDVDVCAVDETCKVCAEVSLTVDCV